MFWDQVIRSLSNAKREGRWICLIVGSSEVAERVLFQGGHSTQRSSDGELDYPCSLASELELTLLEEKRKLATRLTDEGVAAVGMMAFDRGMVQVKDGNLIVKEGIEHRLWQAPAVLPVLMSVTKDEKGCLMDVHPFRIAFDLQAAMGERASISVVSNRVPQGKNMDWQAWENNNKTGAEAPRSGPVSIDRLPRSSNWAIKSPIF